MSLLLENIVSELNRLPGVGRRTALRLAMHILKMEREDVAAMTDSISDFGITSATAPSAETSLTTRFARFAPIQSATEQPSAWLSRWLICYLLKRLASTVVCTMFW